MGRKPNLENLKNLFDKGEDFSLTDALNTKIRQEHNYRKRKITY